jgi:hypothetical protein
MHNILVGTGHEQRVYHIHKTVLANVTYFRNAMKPEWTNGDIKKPIDLTAEDPALVELYLAWLYSGRIVETKQDKDMLFCRLYVLGEMLMHAEFQNAVLDMLVENCQRTKTSPRPAAVEIIYAGTAEGSPAHQLLADMYSWDGSAVFMRIHFNKYPQEFIRDYLCTMININKRAIKSATHPTCAKPTSAEKYYVKTEGK